MPDTPRFSTGNTTTRRPPHRRRGYTMVELMITSVLIITLLYGSGTAFLNFTAAKKRGDAKLRLQEDATQATEQLVRQIRYSDSVNVTGSWAAGDLQLALYDEGDPIATDLIYVTTDAYNRRYFVHNDGGGVHLVVPSPIDSLSAVKFGRVVRLALRLADTTGNKVTTLSSAFMRN